MGEGGAGCLGALGSPWYAGLSMIWDEFLGNPMYQLGTTALGPISQEKFR